MIYISEEESAALVTHELAYEVARQALVAAPSPQSGIFPAVLARSREAINTFSIKSGWSGDLTGVKIGSFWADNPARGLPRHNSAIVLLDQLTGRLHAVVEAGRVTPTGRRPPTRSRQICSRDQAPTSWRYSVPATRRNSRSWRWRACARSSPCWSWPVLRRAVTLSSGASPAGA